MKRILAIMLAMVLALGVLTGCGDSGKDKEKVGGTIADPTSDPVVESSEPEEEELSLGDVAGGTVYTNEFAGITFTLPEEWVFASDAELAAMMDTGADELFDGDNDKLLEYALNSTVYDMMAYSPLGENVMVMFENTARYLGGTSMSEDDYIDALTENLEAMSGTIDYTMLGTSDVRLGNQDYRCLHTSIEGYGSYQDYVIRREGKYMICIAVTAYSDNPSGLVGEYFS